MIVFTSGIVSETVCFGAVAAPPFVAAVGLPFTSLVLTGHEPLRERLRSVAIGRGGICRAPTSVAAAWRAAGADHHLVFIDVARPLDGQVDEARAIAETLAMRQGVLLAVCGRPFRSADVPVGGDDEECWARQMGAFVYLPGVGSDAGVAMLIDEAERIFRRGT
ncbi:MAG: hypothetical protein WCR51_05300 [Planctomycetia bacterium]